MRFIEKQESPDSFESWKATEPDLPNSSWKCLQNPEKTELRNSLIAEQGHICCYCGKRVHDTDSHIEHLRPQKSYRTEKFDYNNILVSCGLQQGKKPTLHCGQAKGNWYEENLFISPLNPDCEQSFRYTASGEILPKDQGNRAATTTIEKLNLNCSSLAAQREDAIEGNIENVESLTTEEIKTMIQAYDTPNDQGKLTPFCFAITNVLRTLI